MSNKTIATVLARPIRRWEFLVGHWFGVTLFSLCSLAIGVMLGGRTLVVFRHRDRPRPSGDCTRANGGRRHDVRRRSASASARTRRWPSPRPSACCWSLCLPWLRFSSNDTRPWQRYSGVVLDYLTPPGYRTHYRGSPGRPTGGESACTRVGPAATGRRLRRGAEPPLHESRLRRGRISWRVACSSCGETSGWVEITRPAMPARSERARLLLRDARSSRTDGRRQTFAHGVSRVRASGDEQTATFAPRGITSTSVCAPSVMP